MAVTLKLTAKAEGALAPPAIFADRDPVIGFNDDGEAQVSFEPGECTLTFEIFGAGASLSLDLEGRPRIIIPVGAEWPFEVEVREDRSAAAGRIYFVIGG
jgi:hypothetical protein